jgi:hypothetical protein
MIRLVIHIIQNSNICKNLISLVIQADLKYVVHERVILKVGQELSRLTSIGKTGDPNAVVD